MYRSGAVRFTQLPDFITGKYKRYPFTAIGLYVAEQAAGAMKE